MTTCPKCKAELNILKHILENQKYPNLLVVDKNKSISELEEIFKVTEGLHQCTNCNYTFEGVKNVQMSTL